MKGQAWHVPPSIASLLRGGWFVEPDEYEQMGFTLGLPPGLYAPANKEIQDLVRKIKSQNGIILPSHAEYFRTRTSAKQQKKKITITNLPLEITEDEIIRLLASNLIRKKLITDEGAILSCHIHSSRFSALVAMRSQKEAEAAVQLGSIIYGQDALGIKWTNQSEEHVDHEQTEIFSLRDTRNCLFVDSVLPIPPIEHIKAVFDETCEVSDIEQPQGFNYCIISLSNPDDTEYAVQKLNDCMVDGVKLRVRKAFCDPNEGPRKLSQTEIRKIKTAAGPSNMYSVVSPLLRIKPCPADILNLDVPVAVAIRPETEQLQKPTGATLSIFNVAPMMAMFNEDLHEEIVNDMTEECSQHGNVVSCEIEKLALEPLPSDYAVVKVVFEDAEQAKMAQEAISGRRYAGRLVITQLTDGWL